MKALYTVLLIGTAGLIQGCAYPQPAQIEQVDRRPAIGIKGAPLKSSIYVDGLRMGRARKYDGEDHVLLVEPGRHIIEIRSDSGAVIHSDTLFLNDSATKIITVIR